jgi:hypothetical protein
MCRLRISEVQFVSEGQHESKHFSTRDIRLHDRDEPRQRPVAATVAATLQVLLPENTPRPLLPTACVHRKRTSHSIDCSSSAALSPTENTAHRLLRTAIVLDKQRASAGYLQWLYWRRRRRCTRDFITAYESVQAPNFKFSATAVVAAALLSTWSGVMLCCSGRTVLEVMDLTLLCFLANLCSPLQHFLPYPQQRL